MTWLCLSPVRSSTYNCTLITLYRLTSEQYAHLEIEGYQLRHAVAHWLYCTEIRFLAAEQTQWVQLVCILTCCPTCLSSPHRESRVSQASGLSSICIVHLAQARELWSHACLQPLAATVSYGQELQDCTYKQERKCSDWSCCVGKAYSSAIAYSYCSPAVSSLTDLPRWPRG